MFGLVSFVKITSDFVFPSVFLTAPPSAPCLTLRMMRGAHKRLFTEICFSQNDLMKDGLATVCQTLACHIYITISFSKAEAYVMKFSFELLDSH